jgi:hypothetical protein
MLIGKTYSSNKCMLKINIHGCVTGYFGRTYVLITLFIISSTNNGNVCAKLQHYLHFTNPSADDTGNAAVLCAFKALFVNSNH